MTDIDPNDANLALDDLLAGRSLADAEPVDIEPLNTYPPMFRRRTHALVGHGEACKSLIAGHVAMTTAARGGYVVIYDGEMNADRWRERLENMGARPEHLARIAYVDMRDPEGWRLIEQAAPLLRLVICDSLAKYLARRVQSENDNAAVTKALDPWRVIANHGPAVAFVDHAAAGADVMVSRGATAKFNDLDVSYGFKLDGGTAPNRLLPWRVRITVEKDRDGAIGHRNDLIATFTPNDPELALSWDESTEQTHRLASDPIATAVDAIAKLDPPAKSANDAAARIGGTRSVALTAYKRWVGR